MSQDNFILNQSTFDNIIKYKDFEKMLRSFDIVNKILDKFSIKVLIKVIFENNINKIKNDELELYKFVNNLELERKIEIKKLIIDHALYLKDENNVYDYKEDFLNVASALNINRDLLYLMNQKIIQKEQIEEKKLRIINI